VVSEVVADGRAVVEGFVVGRQLTDFAGVPGRGHDVRMPICVCYDVAEGRITRARVYLGTGTLGR
jgi:predicted ester cyclase